jgi:Uma2 family endonuclease
MNPSSQVFSSDGRLRVADAVYYYPDCTVVYAGLNDLDVIVHDPCVVIEVTSPSTARIDRGEKLTEYRKIDSLRAYLIIDHRRRRVERHWRDDATSGWMREEVTGEGRVPVPCLDTELTLEAIYDRVELPTVAEPDLIEYEI